MVIKYSLTFILLLAPLSFAIAPRSASIVADIDDHFVGYSRSRLARVGAKLVQIQHIAHTKFHENRKLVVVAQDDLSNIDDDENNRRRFATTASSIISGDQSISSYLFEGDILLTEHQADSILTNLQTTTRKAQSRRRRKRSNLSADIDSRWIKLPIEMTYHQSLAKYAVDEIAKAIRYWQDNTCLTFRLVADKPPIGDYIEFFKGQGCYSMIGRYGGRQGISIGDGCERAGIIQHEIAHALGMWHEQSRPDSECCIRVMSDFVKPNYVGDFLHRSPNEIDTLNVPYDLGSVMHYGSKAFSADGASRTIVTNDARYQSTIGQRERLSFYDVHIINKAYCKDRCKLQLPCQHGGYTHPGNCNRCICPDGLGGIHCEHNEASTNGVCGGVLNVGADWTTFESPGYPTRGYASNQKCSWLLKSASTNDRIEMQFVDKFQFLCTTTCLDYVELKTSADLKNTGFRHCCYERPTQTFISDTNLAIVIFRSTISQDVGFRIKIRSTKQMPPTTISPPLRKASIGSVNDGMLLWSTWTAWTTCSRSCGACGVRMRQRFCISDACRNMDNSQEENEFNTCNTQPCPIDAKCIDVIESKIQCDATAGGECAAKNKKSELTDCDRQPICCAPYYLSGGKCQKDDEGS